MSDILVENYIKEFLIHENLQKEVILEGRILDYFKKKLGFTPDYNDLSKINRKLKNKSFRRQDQNKRLNRDKKKVVKSYKIPITIMTLLVAFYLNKNNLEITDSNIVKASDHVKKVSESSPEVVNRFLDPNVPISEMTREELMLLSSSQVEEFDKNQEEYQHDVFKEILKGEHKVSDYVEYLKNLNSKDWREQLVHFASYVQNNTLEFDESDVRALRFLISVFDSSKYNENRYYSKSIKMILYVLENPEESSAPGFDINDLPEYELPNLVFDRDIFDEEIDDWN